ncbi:MAG: hypothetical protein QXW80_03055 [Candidatus Micrarchaeia archaeon]|uniref:hypothetical protein n=1 Tax=Saccharolobus sp. TaxID=2100761 RepID=UPI0031765A55
MNRYLEIIEAFHSWKEYLKHNKLDKLNIQDFPLDYRPIIQKYNFLIEGNTLGLTYEEIKGFLKYVLNLVNEMKDFKEYEKHLKSKRDNQTSICAYTDPKTFENYVLKYHSPNCDLCTNYKCTIVDPYKRIKCLNRRAYLFYNLDYDYFNIDRHSMYYELGRRLFWKMFRRYKYDKTK